MDTMRHAAKFLNLWFLRWQYRDWGGILWRML